MKPGYVAFVTEIHPYEEVSPEMKRLLKISELKQKPGWAAMATPKDLK